MTFIIIFLIYIIGVFVAIALSAWVTSDYTINDAKEMAFLSIFSWVLVAAILLIYIALTAWEVIKYPFVWFYNKCNEKFRKT